MTTVVNPTVTPETPDFTYLSGSEYEGEGPAGDEDLGC